jgi:cysteine-rich repeat protein
MKRLYATAPLLLTLLGAACRDPGCGDGVQATDEACDDGDGNSDSTPDACRTDCQLPFCGDGVTDQGETCDDANLLGGDGCTDRCEVETGEPEQEPNDAPDPLGAPFTGPLLHGALPPGDVDCFPVVVPVPGAFSARQLPDLADGTCSNALILELWSPDGTRQAAGLPTLQTSCGELDPNRESFARYLLEGSYALCVTGALDASSPAYSLTIETLDTCAGLDPLPPNPGQDLDGDQLADVCDPDDDADGVDDLDDNCPAVPNGPAQPVPHDTSNEGFVPFWLALGPFTTGVTPGGCEPSPDPFLGDDAAAAPVLGDEVDDLTWRAVLPASPTTIDLNFTSLWSPAAPREAYAAVWIRSPEDRAAELGLGVDDGLRAWLNGEELGEVTSCQGVGTDNFVFDADLLTGWNRLVLKVYDGGGGWGLRARLRWKADALPMDDLELSLVGPQTWTNDQDDADQDGLGDACDPTP